MRYWRRGLAGRGWRVTVVTLSGTGGEAAAVLRANGVAFLSLGNAKGTGRSARLAAAERMAAAGTAGDSARASVSRGVDGALVAALAPRCIVIDTIHTAGTGTAGRRLGYRGSNWLAERVTAVSQGAAEAWIAAGMVPRDKVEIVANGIDTERWKPDPQARARLRAELGLRDEFLWLAAGRLEPGEELFRAATRYHRSP